MTTYQQVVKLRADGMTQAAIARKLGISTGAVAYHTGRMPKPSVQKYQVNFTQAEMVYLQTIIMLDLEPLFVQTRNALLKKFDLI